MPYARSKVRWKVVDISINSRKSCKFHSELATFASNRIGGYEITMLYMFYDTLSQSQPSGTLISLGDNEFLQMRMARFLPCSSCLLIYLLFFLCVCVLCLSYSSSNMKSYILYAITSNVSIFGQWTGWLMCIYLYLHLHYRI